MKMWAWALSLAGLLATYCIAVTLLGFEGTLGIAINLGRVAIGIAVLILYFPAIKTIFREVPPPGRDYLLAGILFVWSSNVGFAFWNEAGKIFGVTTSIFVSPIAGFFSLLLLLGGAFHLSAPAVDGRRRKLVAALIGLAIGSAFVFIAPLFRP